MSKQHKPYYPLFLLFFITQWFFTGNARAQGNNQGVDSFKHSFTKELALRLHYGVVYAHTKQVKNTDGAHPRGFEIETAIQMLDRKNWDDYRCYPRMGLVFSYFNYNSQILGKSYSASYFLEPNYRLSTNTSFFLRGAVGLSYLTNPHDSLKNPTNQSYSLPVNAFLALGVGLNYNVNKHWALSVLASFQHNSNGGFDQPNHGINFPTASLGIKYNFDGNALPAYRKTQMATSGSKKPTVDVGLYFTPKSGYSPTWAVQRKYVAGAYVQVSKQFNSLDAITAMVEVYNDNALASIKRNIGDNSTSVMAGFMLGHEFIFRHIIFSQQLGVYVFKNTRTFSQLYFQEFPAIYHRWGLRYKLNSHLYAGFNLLARKQVADFIDVRLAYRF